MTTKRFIDKCKTKFPDEPYDYSITKYESKEQYIRVLCTVHNNIMIVKPYGFLKSKGCSECRGIKYFDTDTWIESAKQVHGDVYDYSKVTYVNANTKVKIICRIHGKFKVRPWCHMNG